MPHTRSTRLKINDFTTLQKNITFSYHEPLEFSIPVSIICTTYCDITRFCTSYALRVYGFGFFNGIITNHFPKEQGFLIEKNFCQKPEFSIRATQNS
jgi:hypothetical protein